MKTPALLVFLAVAISQHLAAQTKPLCSVEINAGKYTRSHTPVQVPLPKPLPLKTYYTLKNTRTGKTAIGQLQDSITLVFILPDSLPPGTVQTYSVSKLPAGKQPKNAVTVNKTSTALEVKINNKPIFVYHTAPVKPPADSPLYYTRSGFIHPLYSPGGQILTDDFPAGHAHQHAIFNAWTNTTFRGTHIDFWNQHQQTGTVEHIEVTRITEGPVFTELRVKLRHKSLQFGEVLREMWVIRVYPFSNYYLFDLISEERNVTTDTLFLNKYHYGGLGFRGSSQWNNHDKKHYKEPWALLTSEGMHDSAANHTHARWIDASGKINGIEAGATVFDHPLNFRYPQTIRVHPEMPYWVYSPVVDGTFTINPGTWYRSQYRYFVHQHRADVNTIERFEKDWVVPPLVKVAGL